jgi:arginyl-tRNA synthetase
MPASARETVRQMLAAAVSEVAAATGFTPPAELPIERTKRPEHGDFASNVALVVAKGAGKPPRAVAEAIVARLSVGEGSPLAEANIAGPGFINVRLSAGYWQGMLPTILAAGDEWGRGPARAAPKISLEYLSANPTGPITVAHGRHCAVGDSLARLLRFAGYEVTPEYYINDAGNQVQMLALSVWTRYMENARAADASRRSPSPRTATRGPTSATSGATSSRARARAGSAPRRPRTSTRSAATRSTARWL